MWLCGCGGWKLEIGIDKAEQEIELPKSLSRSLFPQLNPTSKTSTLQKSVIIWGGLGLGKAFLIRNHKIGVVHYLFCFFVCLFVDSLEVMDGLMLIRILAVLYCTYVCSSVLVASLSVCLSVFIEWESGSLGLKCVSAVCICLSVFVFMGNGGWEIMNRISRWGLVFCLVLVTRY